MIDVESVNGQVSGNQSQAINAQHDELAEWLGSSKRVVGYGNVHDLNVLWPQKPSGMRIIVAAFGSNPDSSGQVESLDRVERRARTLRPLSARMGNVSAYHQVAAQV